MSQLSSTDRDQLLLVQEGLAGTREMDDRWLTTAIRLLRGKPGLFKGMLQGKGALIGGFSDEQIGSFIDSLAAMEERTLRYCEKATYIVHSLCSQSTSVFLSILDVQSIDSELLCIAIV